jgi:uncharacterized repeat protein (TIGR02543 family)
MDKESLTNYGWIIVVAMVGVVMLSMVTPLGHYIVDSLKTTTIENIEDSSFKENENATETVTTNNKKTISYNLDGGEFSGGYISAYVPGTEVTLPINVAKDNYDFGGWYSNSSYSGNSIATIESNQSTNLTFYAKWIPKKFIVTYNSGGGIFTRPNDVQYYYTYNEDFILPTEIVNGAIQKTGYTFDGWYNTDTDAPFVYSKGVSGNISLYAKWK